MAQSILIFDFGADEASAQQARHKVDAWKQGFRLGNKMQLKFERPEESGEDTDTVATESDEKKPAKAKTAGHGKRAKGEKPEEKEEGKGSGHVRVLLRLDFSDHEKLSQQRWLDRIPSEEPFKSVKGETIRAADDGFKKIAAVFDSLD